MFQLMAIKNEGCNGATALIETTVRIEGHIAFGRMGKDSGGQWIEYASVVAER